MKFIRRRPKDRFNVMANAIRVHLGSLLDCLYGCSHRRTSFPITLRARVTGDGQQNTHAETHIVCVECGRQFAYDWDTMHMARHSAARAADRRFEAGDRTSTPCPAVNGFLTSARVTP